MLHGLAVNVRMLQIITSIQDKQFYGSIVITQKKKQSQLSNYLKNYESKEPDSNIKIISLNKLIKNEI